MTSKEYQTADEAIEEIKSRATLVATLIPNELMEAKYSKLIEDNLGRSIEAIEKDRNYKFADFDRLVYQFGYGCSLRAVARKAKKINQLSPELEKLFLEGIADDIPECSFCGKGWIKGELTVSVQDANGPTHWHHAACKAQDDAGKGTPTWDEAMDVSE